MTTYEVSEQKHDRKTVTVKARNEFSAVKKAHEHITGKKATAAVTWHGVYAEIDGAKYNKPIRVSD